MASNTKQAIQEALRLREDYTSNYMGMFKSLYHNSIELVDSDVPKRYLFEVLLNRGAVAYDRATGLYLPFTRSGIDVYGLPKNYTLIGANGFIRQRQPSEVVILRANDLEYAEICYLRAQTKKLVEIDMSFLQNLDAIRTTTYMECPDESVALSVANAYYARKCGATVVFGNKQSALNKTVQSLRADVPYLGAELLEARKEILNETLSVIGISVANTDKRERVQSIEVLASQGFAHDMLSTLVETFNYDAEQGDIPIRLVANTTLAMENKVNETNSNPPQSNDDTDQ